MSEPLTLQKLQEAAKMLDSQLREHAESDYFVPIHPRNVKWARKHAKRLGLKIVTSPRGK